MVGFDGMFRPEDNITYYETVKTLMSMIGYTAFVNDTAPYPGEYLKIANNEGMTKNLLDKSQHDLTAAEVA